MLLVDYDFFELRFAVVANVFIDGHWCGPRNGLLDDYSRICGLPSGRNLLVALAMGGGSFVVARSLYKDN